jgi:hypothetical protein
MFIQNNLRSALIQEKEGRESHSNCDSKLSSRVNSTVTEEEGMESKSTCDSKLLASSVNSTVTDEEGKELKSNYGSKRSSSVNSNQNFPPNTESCCVKMSATWEFFAQFAEKCLQTAAQGCCEILNSKVSLFLLCSISLFGTLSVAFFKYDDKETDFFNACLEFSNFFLLFLHLINNHFYESYVSKIFTYIDQGRNQDAPGSPGKEFHNATFNLVVFTLALLYCVIGTTLSILSNLNQPDYFILLDAVVTISRGFMLLAALLLIFANYQDFNAATTYLIKKVQRESLLNFAEMRRLIECKERDIEAVVTLVQDGKTYEAFKKKIKPIKRCEGFAVIINDISIFAMWILILKVRIKPNVLTFFQLLYNCCIVLLTGFRILQYREQMNRFDLIFGGTSELRLKFSGYEVGGEQIVAPVLGVCVAFVNMVFTSS